MNVQTASESVVRGLLSEGGVRFGEGRSFRGLTLFPLFLSGGEAERDYLLFAEALQGGHVAVEELGQGVVSTLVVHNRGERPVLLVQGEQILGLRQNRMVNSSVLVGAGARVEVPVACVEQGRWRLGPGGAVCADTLYPNARSLTAEAVTRSVRQRGARDADQTALWQEVAAKLAELGASSSTWAASEAYRTRREELDEYVRALPSVPGQCGVAALSRAAWPASTCSTIRAPCRPSMRGWCGPLHWTRWARRTRVWLLPSLSLSWPGGGRRRGPYTRRWARVKRCA